ncbi:MAG TPA: MBG domain-containing protein, partial [Bryobacteraceae bacterium]
GTYTYDTTAHAATVTITGVQGDNSLTAAMVTLSYTPGDAAAPVNAGKYTATGTFAGNQNYNAASGTADIIINKADAKVAVTGGTYTYDANPHPATATVTGVTGDSSLASATVTLTYAPGDTAPVNAGSYKATGTFAGNQNYNSATGSDTITINKADAKVTVTPYSVTYDATAHKATGTATGVKGEALNGLDLSATTHTNAGTTTDTWTFTDATGNYNNTSGTVSDTISKANVTVTVTGGTFTYSASAHPATATIAGVTGDTSLIPSMVNLSYDPGGIAPVNVGSYTVTGTFAGNPNYNPGSGTANITINKATPALTVTGGTYTYDAKPHPGSATITGVQGDNSLASMVTLTYIQGGAAAPVNAGSYTVTASFAGNSNYNSVTSDPASIIINQASATINVQGYTGPYDGNGHGATGSAVGVVGENLTSLLNLGDTFVHVPGGTANWSFAGNNNYKPASGTAAISLFAASTNTALTSVLGQSSGAVTATLTAAVSSAAPLGGGIVTFTDGSNNNAVLGTSGLTAGKASITIQAGSLAAGSHVITATYAPSSLDFTGSASASNTAPGVTITSPSSGYVNPITSPVNFSATLSGVNATLNPCACAEWTFTNTGTNASTIGTGTISGTTITGSNTFTSAGVFGITLTFTDGSGDVVIANTVSAPNAPANLPAMVVIYDSSAGFVTGGGWINSPAGAYTANPSLTGKATFGFVSKYQKGATIPTGDTQFTFQVGKL